MYTNKENITQGDLKGDRFIPNSIRPSAFQMEYQDKESQGSNY